jgi:hypothetical protein
MTFVPPEPSPELKVLYDELTRLQALAEKYRGRMIMPPYIREDLDKIRGLYQVIQEREMEEWNL